MEAEQRKLHAHIKALEKDIANAKKEIEARSFSRSFISG
jgi:hypothetical protein